MREIRTSGSEGGAGRKPRSYLYQAELDGVDDFSTETPTHRNTETAAIWPEGLPDQVAAVRKLLPTIGQDPESLAACFGRKNKKRTDQITAILATLKALGHIA